MKRMVLGLLLVGCSSSSDSQHPAVDAPSNTPDAKLIDAAPGSLALTSTAFVEGGKIPMTYGCNGQQVSPPLAWDGGPNNVKSYALVVLDPDANNFQHWVIYDIPATTQNLPENVEKTYEPANVGGAHQTVYSSTGIGYRPMCPPEGKGAHEYKFTLTALDVATLPGATKSTTATQAIATIELHKLASFTLTGTYAR